MAARENEYHPGRSQVSPDVLEAFKNKKLTGVLTEIPGVGPKTAELLGKCGITSTFDLIDEFLSFQNGRDMEANARIVDPVELTQKFYSWLQHDVGINGRFLSDIVRCIAERANISFPGIYDPTAYMDIAVVNSTPTPKDKGQKTSKGDKCMDIAFTVDKPMEKAGKPEPMRACEHCGESASFQCGKCMCAFYCSVEHQRADWDKHKKICRSLVTNSTPAPKDKGQGTRKGDQNTHITTFNPTPTAGEHYQFLRTALGRRGGTRVTKYELVKGDSRIRVTFAEFFRLLSLPDSGVHGPFFDALRVDKSAAYLFECPSISLSTIASTAFEFVLTSSPELSRKAVDKEPFEERMRGALARGSNVMSFPSLGGRSLLIIPCPSTLDEDTPPYFTHLASFMRGASAAHVQNFWAFAASELGATLQRFPDQRIWLSTNGLEVSWLHLRLELEPKFYFHEPYKCGYVASPPVASPPVPCYFFAQGYCRNGESCRFSHDLTGPVGNIPPSGRPFRGTSPAYSGSQHDAST